MAIGIHTSRVISLYYVRDPEKLTRVGEQTPLTLR